MRRGTSSQPLPPSPTMIVLSVEISDGSLSSKVSIPVDAAPAEREKAVTRWLDIMMFGLKQHGSEIEIVATIPKAEERSEP